MAIDFRGFNTVVQAPATSAANTAPAMATYGPTGATVVQDGSGVVGTHPAQLRVYAGWIALGGLVLIRQSAPQAHRRTVDTVIVVSLLVDVIYGTFKMNAKRRVQEGTTSGIGGTLAQTWSV